MTIICKLCDVCFSNDHDYAFHIISESHIKKEYVFLKTENEDLKRKGEQLCQQNGELLMEIERLRKALRELIEVADLRGDSTLPHPADDPHLWTARMQDAWNIARQALEGKKGPIPTTNLGPDGITTPKNPKWDCSGDIIEDGAALLLTLDQLEAMEPAHSFAHGEMPDTEDGLFMTGSGKMLKWVAVRGGNNDWAIYCHFAESTYEWIGENGDKVYMKEHIRKLVPCTDEAYARYRF